MYLFQITTICNCQPRQPCKSLSAENLQNLEMQQPQKYPNYKQNNNSNCTEYLDLGMDQSNEVFEVFTKTERPKPTRRNMYYPPIDDVFEQKTYSGRVNAEPSVNRNVT